MKHLLYAVMTFISVPLCAQWQKTLGPYGGNIDKFVVVKDSIAAITSNKQVYVSALKDIEWKESSKILPARIIISENRNLIYCHKDIIYACTDSGLYRSDDFAESWRLAYSTLGRDSVVNVMITDSLLIAVLCQPWGEPAETHISTNNGRSWRKATINDGYIYNGTTIRALGVGDTLVVYVNHQNAYVTFNRGRDWKEIKPLELKEEIRINDIAINEMEMIAATNLGLYLSKDFGESWEKIDSSGYSTRVYSLYDFLLVNNYTRTEKYEKKNGKYIFRSVIFPDINIKDLVINGNELIAATLKGCYISTDQGETWSEKNEKMDAVVPIGMGKIDGKLIISSVGNGAFKTEDLDETWANYGLYFKYPCFKQIYQRGGVTMYLTYDSYGSVVISKDGGQSWTRYENELDKISVNCLKLLENRTIAGTKKGIYISQDTGRTWKITDTKLGNTNIFDFAENNRGLFAATSDGLLFSSDSGSAWTPINYSFAERKIRKIVSEENNIYAFSDSGYVYVSADGGLQWNTIPTEFHSPISACIVNNNLIISVYEKGVYLSTDSGNSWRLISDEDMGSYINCMVIYKDHLVAGTSTRNTWKAKLSDFGITSAVEDDYKLEGGNYLYCFPPYPNPARNEVRSLIYWDTSLDIDKDDISVYNLFGKVAGREDIIIEKTAPYSGYLVWDCSRYEPGVYFIVVRHGDATQMIKAIVER